MDHCKRGLLSAKANAGQRSTKHEQQPGDVFVLYSQCLAKQAALAVSCVPVLQTACQSSDVRVVKTVRAAMLEMDQLFQTLPNFRLVHLIRDPRGVITSRKGDPSFRGIGSLSQPIEVVEARIYCREVLRDIKARRILEERWVLFESI